MKKYKLLNKLLFSLICLFFFTTAAFAQSVARYNSQTKNLEFGIGSFTKDKIIKASLYDSGNNNTTLIPVTRINQINFGRLQIVVAPAEEPVSLASDPATLTLIIQPDPNKNERTIITLQIVSTITTVNPSSLENEEANDRDNANIYLSGEAIVERKQKPQLTLDIKLQREYAVKDVPLRFAPFLEIKASNDDAATDKSNGGVRFISTANKLRYEGSGEIETDYKFRVTNLITSQELRYLIPSLRYPKPGTPNAILFPRLFIGAELGRNLKSPVERDSRGIARLKAGASLTLKIFEPFKKFTFLKVGIQDLVWENRFQQRWFLLKEQAYDTEDDVLILKDFGRKPRSHVESVLNFKFNDFFGPAIKYEWGELPPLYKKVDHRVTFGLVFSLARNPS